VANDYLYIIDRKILYNYGIIKSKESWYFFMFPPQETVVLTTMTMVYNDANEMLVVMRTKNDWPGLNFPGGHVEPGEDLASSATREVFEETGLKLRSIECVGVYSWTIYGNNRRDLAVLYRSSDFSGTLQSSLEGEVFFIKFDAYKQYALSHDFEKIYEIMLRGL
jgi:8-oxo-dGTP diphosphatase